MGVLALGPAHGYDIKRVHDERFPASKKLAFGQVYATLGRLERHGPWRASRPARTADPSDLSTR